MTHLLFQRRLETGPLLSKTERDCSKTGASDNRYETVLQTLRNVVRLEFLESVSSEVEAYIDPTRVRD